MHLASALTLPLNLLLWGLLIWLLTLHPTVASLKAGGLPRSITVSLASPGTVSPEVAPLAPVVPIPEPHAPAPRRPVPPTPVIAVARPPIEPAPAPVTAPIPPPAANPANDMMALVQARRQRRDAEAQYERTLEQSDSAAETPEQRANRIAQANVAATSGSPRGSHHAVFEVRSVRPRDAELIFNGWNQDFHHDWAQQFSVQQGGESSLELAVVKKMIEVIRQHTQGDFVWASYRLGRDVRLSARNEDIAGLTDFLMLEFKDQFGSSPAPR